VVLIIAVGLVDECTAGLAAVAGLAAGALWFVEAWLVEAEFVEDCAVEPDCAQAAEAANIITKIANIFLIDAPC
jgi:hypothetical protein